MQVNSLIGKKTDQKQVFLEDGKRVPVSVVATMKNYISQIKTSEKEGYNALQIGIDTRRKVTKSIANHGKKAGLEQTPRFFKEIRVDDLEGVSLGSSLNPSDILKPGDMVDVTGISKGKGFQGGVKRHNFKGGPRTHGQSDRERAPGSIGQTTTPGRVYKGKRMAGRMGTDRVTVKNLEVINVTDDGQLIIKGLIPGSLNSVVVVKKVGENKKFVPLYEEKVETEAPKEEVAEEVKEEPKTEESQAQESLEAKNEEVVEEVKVEEDSKEKVEETKGEENANS